MTTRNEELAAFVQCNHRKIGDILYATEPRLKIPETDQRVIYENEQQNILLTYSFKGAFMGQVFLYVNQEQHALFWRILEFVKYLELCKRKEIRPERIERYLKDVIPLETAEEKPESPTEKSKLTGFLLEKDRIRLKEDGKIKTPSCLIVDGEEWNLEHFSYETGNQILEKLYNGQYQRIEITYRTFYERKGRKIPQNTTSLVYLCEDGKAVMQYFEEETLYTGIFFENRNDAGMIDTELLPRIQIRGQEVYEQNVILERGILGKVCREMLSNGCIDYDQTSRNGGYFSRRYFSNKNAYIKYRNEKGEFELQ